MKLCNSINAGAVKAQRELAAQGIRITIIRKGALKEDDREQQVQVVENFVGRCVSGKIPVVIIDSSLASTLQSSFVATDNREGGRIAARNQGKMFGGSGNVIMLRYAVGSNSTEVREAGFLEVMKIDFPGIKLLSTGQHAGAMRDSAKRVAENLLRQYGAHLTAPSSSLNPPPPECCFRCGNPAWPAAR